MLMPIMGYMRRLRAIFPLLLVATLGLVPVDAVAQTDAIEDAKEVKENAYEGSRRQQAELDDAIFIAG